MSRYPYPPTDVPRTRKQGGSVVVTIPRGIVESVGVGPGAEPEWEWDDEAGEAVMRIVE